MSQSIRLETIQSTCWNFLMHYNGVVLAQAIMLPCNGFSLRYQRKLLDRVDGAVTKNEGMDEAAWEPSQAVYYAISLLTLQFCIYLRALFINESIYTLGSEIYLELNAFQQLPLTTTARTVSYSHRPREKSFSRCTQIVLQCSVPGF